MNKSELRKLMISMLRRLNEIEKLETEKQLTKRLLSSEQWAKADVIGITISQPLEWSTKPIIEAGWKQGKTIVVPRCVPKEKKLQFYKFTSYDELEVVYYNLKEPIADPTKYTPKELIDLIVVPGLVFDYSGYRVGFGAGYYDRFLADYTGTTISIISEFQLANKLPVESFDIPIDHILTDMRTFK